MTDIERDLIRIQRKNLKMRQCILDELTVGKILIATMTITWVGVIIAFA